MSGLLGVHVSISGSIDQAVDRARGIGCTTFQIFTRNPRGWQSKEISSKVAGDFIEKSQNCGFTSIVAHMPYLPNLASSESSTYDKSVETLTSEVSRCGKLNIPYLVTHLGSHLGKGVETGIENVSSACRTALESVDNDVMILLENMAGTKNSVGSSFENIKVIADTIDNDERIGVCFDTCHAFAAGYDLRDEESVNGTFSEFDRVMDVSRIKVVHINDSLGELGSSRDRHEHIGIGHIGEDGFRAVLNDLRIKQLPMILETPYDSRRGDEENLSKVRELSKYE